MGLRFFVVPELPDGEPQHERPRRTAPTTVCLPLNSAGKVVIALRLQTEQFVFQSEQVPAHRRNLIPRPFGAEAAVVIDRVNAPCSLFCHTPQFRWLRVALRLTHERPFGQRPKTGPAAPAGPARFESRWIILPLLRCGRRNPRDDSVAQSCDIDGKQTHNHLVVGFPSHI